jgi:hypothetical protein
MRRRVALLVAVAAAALGVPAPSAHADGDPASDVLLSQDVFYPYQPNTVSKPLQDALNAMLRAARKQGFPLKVAVISAKTDLGSVPQMLADPQQYAYLLTSEISYNEHPRVLVVLPTGIGGNNLGDNAGPALQGVTPDPNGGADGLTRTAMQAVRKLTVAAGKPVALPAVASQSGGSGSGSGGGGGGAPAVLVFGLPVLLVVAAAGLAAARTRARGSSDEDD